MKCKDCIFEIDSVCINPQSDWCDMKLFPEYDGYADGFLVYDTWICPSCGRYYELDCSDDYIYCPQCGQLLDWSTLER